MIEDAGWWYPLDTEEFNNACYIDELDRILIKLKRVKGILDELPTSLPGASFKTVNDVYRDAVNDIDNRIAKVMEITTGELAKRGELDI